MVVPAFPKLSEAFLVDKFLGLLNRGWDVHVVCGKSARSAWNDFPALKRVSGSRRRVHRSWPRAPKWKAASLFFLSFLNCLFANPQGALLYLARGWRAAGFGVLRRFYLDSVLIQLRPALLHFEFGALMRGRTYLKEWLDCRLVASFRGYDLNYSGLEDPNCYRDVWKNADALHLLGRDLWDRAQLRGCPQETMHSFISPAVNPLFLGPVERETVDSVGTPARPYRILSVGRMEWIKGYEYSLEAVRKLRDRGIECEFRIVGAGEMQEAVAFVRHQLGLQDVVHFLGAQERNRVVDEMCWADVFLHSAVSEGFCNAVMEAQAMELPVVCTDAGGLSENVLDGETGFVVPRRDADAIAEKLMVLALAPQRRREMGAAGRHRVLERFQLDEQISAFNRLYHEVFATGRQNAGAPAPAPDVSSARRLIAEG